MVKQMCRLPVLVVGLLAAFPPGCAPATKSPSAPAALTRTAPAARPAPPPPPPPPAGLSPEQEAAAQAISARRLKEAVDFLAAPERGGRISGSPGHREARDWIRARMAELRLSPRGRDGDYLYGYPTHPHRDRFQRNADGTVSPHVNDAGCNVIGLLPGSDPALAHEVLILLAHYDHLGVDARGVPFPGAFDNAGGVAVALEVARALAAPGAAPRRSILFLITDDEENGLSGARAWLAAPTVPLGNVVLAISADPLGRRIVPEYGAIAVAGLERSPAALAFWRGTVGFAEHDVVFIHRNLIPRFTSDHDCFYELNPPIPAAWLTNPGMTFYHKQSDTAATIDYRILLDSARYAARALALAGNSAERWVYVGVPPVGPGSVRDARPMFEHLRGAASLSDGERATIDYLFAELAKSDAAGGDKLGPAARVTLGKAFFFLFQLGYTHPGPVPPPFPGAEGDARPGAAPPPGGEPAGPGARK